MFIPFGETKVRTLCTLEMQQNTDVIYLFRKQNEKRKGQERKTLDTRY